MILDSKTEIPDGVIIAAHIPGRYVLFTGSFFKLLINPVQDRSLLGLVLYLLVWIGSFCIVFMLSQPCSSIFFYKQENI